MKTKMLALSTVALTLFTVACSANTEEGKSTETGSVAEATTSENVAGEEDNSGQDSTEAEPAEDEAELGEKDEVAALVNLYLGTMGANTLYAEQVVNRPADEKLYDAMDMASNVETLAEIVRSGETLFMETVDYDNMTDLEIYNFVQAQFRNAALYAMSTEENGGEPLEITVSADNFHKLNNGDMLFLDYPEKEFINNEGIDSLEEYDIAKDNDTIDLVVSKVNGEWKMHSKYIENYVDSMGIAFEEDPIVDKEYLDMGTINANEL